MIAATRAQRRALEAENRKQPSALRRIPEVEWTPLYRPDRIVEVWRSRDFLVQIFQEPGGMERISVCRTSLAGGKWVDGISWDDLQRLKRECGRGGMDAVEIFPADRDVVNVANMRHLWVVPNGVDFKWRNSIA